jgi:Fe-S cluster biogenesis protein NfuA
VFIGKDFITITKENDLEWDLVKPNLLSKIHDFFSSDQNVIKNSPSKKKANDNKKKYTKKDLGIVNQIKELLDERIKPAVAQDGGDITFQSFEEGIVYLHMQGACAGCPSSTMTLKMGIENLLKHYIPEVTEVRPVA